MTTAVRPARVGIVGCGDVTNLYLPGVAPYASIELAACTDLDPARRRHCRIAGVSRL